MNPDTKKKIIIASIAIFVSITAFSILTWPKITIAEPKDELAPNETIKINTGPLTKITNIRVEKVAIPEESYLNPEGILTIRGYAYDSEYTIYAYAESTNPFLKLFGIGGKDIETIRTWTTPKVEKIEILSPFSREITNNFAELNSPGVKIKVTFSREMKPSKTSFILNNKILNEGIGWATDRKSAVVNLFMPEYSNVFSVKQGALDYENHPLASSISINLNLQKNLLRSPVVFEVEKNILGIYLPATVEWFDTGITGNLTGYAWGEASNDPEGYGITMGPDGDPGSALVEWRGLPALLPGAPLGALLGKDGQNGNPVVLGSNFSLNVGKSLIVTFHDVHNTFSNNSGGYFIKIYKK